MRKIDIMYDNLLELLTAITYDNPAFTVYHDGKAPNLQNDLVDLADSIFVERAEIIKAKMRLEFYPDFTNLIFSLENYEHLFSDFPGFRKNEIFAIISLLQKLAIEYGATTINLEEVIDETEFGLQVLAYPINKKNFFIFDTSNYKSSLLLFNLSSIQEFKTFINGINTGAQILFFLLSKIGESANPLNSSKYILVDSTYLVKPKTVWATLCLHIVKSGESIHQSYEYNLPPKFSPLSNVVLGNTYQQFEDSLDIISEYNYHKDILDKYLRIYHVFENFMFKAPLVSLELNANGDIFSIRDFKRMYNKIDDSELNMLKKLFEEILKLNYSATLTYSNKILGEWIALIPTHFPDAVKIDAFLKKINVVTNKGADITHAYVDANTIFQVLPKLIYCVRNSIVHNRETEFHLTHLNLINHPTFSDTVKILLEQFLIPNLEEIVFTLITTRNNIVWYGQSKLTLWNEV